MRNDFTDITVVLDRSGSMASCQNDAEGGLNAFVAKQKEAPGSALFTLVQFDTEYESVYRGMPINSVPQCYVHPRGMTALLDAVGRAIVETGDRLKTMPEASRPGLVVFVIITDGAENASREYTKAKIKEMIEHQQSVYKWQFTFLGANQDTFGEAAGMGILRTAALNYNQAKMPAAFGAVASNVVRMRGMSAGGQHVNCNYTPEEIKSVE